MSARFALAVGALAAAALGALGWGLAAVRADLETPRDLHGAPHATSRECQRCHPSEYASWRRTFHRTMTQEASDVSVLADFDGARHVYGGVEVRAERGPAGSFELTFHGPDGTLAEATVARTVGSRRVQQYLAREGDVLFRLPVAWDVAEGRWFHMNAAFLTPDPPGLDGVVTLADYNRHVTRWNDNCVFCHNVGANPGWTPARERYATEVAELGIACEACHGPADEHARRNANPLRRYALHLSDAPDPTVVNPARLSPTASAAVCGRCHGQRITANVERFLRDGDPFVPGDDLADYSRPLARDTPLRGDDSAFAARFWPDGTARLTAYEYQGLLASPCEGLTCTDCHGMHEGDPRGQLRPEREGDGACLGCHADDDHDRHAATRCVDCHMPRVVYGVVAVHRSHRIAIPDPWREDRPDACSLCHADRPLGWVQAGYAGIFGGPVARSSAPGARAAIDALAGDPVERAVALAALGRTEGLLPGARSTRLGILFDTMREDPYPALRTLAHRSARALAGAPLAGFDATAPAAARRAAVARLADGLEVRWPAPEEAAALRMRAANHTIFIGE